MIFCHAPIPRKGLGNNKNKHRKCYFKKNHFAKYLAFFLQQGLATFNFQKAILIQCPRKTLYAANTGKLLFFGSIFYSKYFTFFVLKRSWWLLFLFIHQFFFWDQLLGKDFWNLCSTFLLMRRISFSKSRGSAFEMNKLQVDDLVLEQIYSFKSKIKNWSKKISWVFSV